MAKPTRALGGCPYEGAAQAMKRLSGRWKVLIVRRLLEVRSAGFNELQRSLGTVSAKMLNQQLSELQADGILTRHELVSSPPKTVRYELSELGATLAPVIDALAEWGTRAANMTDDQPTTE